MKLSLRMGLPSRWPSFGLATSNARAAIVRAFASLVAWRWGRPLGRALLIAGALAILACIGRSTLAGAAAQPPIATAATGIDPAPTTSTAVAVAVITPPAPQADVPTPPQDAHRGAPTPDDPVFLNQATQEDLQRLPGIGAKRAQSILALRTKLGRFRQVEDLMKVRGIGRATMKRLRPLVKLDPPAPPDGGIAG